VVFPFPPLPEVRADLMQLLDDAAPRSSSYPTTHQTTYIPNSTHDEVYYVQHCSSESGSLLTTFGVFVLHAAVAPPWPSLLIQAHDGPSSLLTKISTKVCSLSNHAYQFPLLLSLPFLPPPSQSYTNRPLWVRASLTSLLLLNLLLLKEKYVRQNSTFSASSSAHDARRHLHP
jgi:hypothetical protein